MADDANEPSRGACDPYLFAFLRQRIQAKHGLKRWLLAQTWTERIGPCSPTTIDQWLRGTTPLTQSNAERLLAVADEHQRGMVGEWLTMRASLQGSSGTTGLFDYRSNKYGLLRELDLAGAVNRGMTVENIASQLVEIDSELFSSGLRTDEDANWVGAIEDWEGICSAEPDAWRIWVDESNKIVCYWLFVNPRPEKFFEACLGGYPEVEITLDSVRPIRSGPIHIYGPGIYVRKQLCDDSGRGLKSISSILSNLMISSFLLQLYRLERDGLHISQICIPAYSEEGRRLIRRYGLSPMPHHISMRYAKELGWAFREAKGGPLPEIFHSWVDAELRARTGLPEMPHH